MRNLLIDRITDLWKNGNKGSFESLDEIRGSSGGAYEDNYINMLCDSDNSPNGRYFILTYNTVTKSLVDFCHNLSDESLVEWYTTMVQESVLNDLFSDNGRATLQEHFGG